MTEKQKTTIPIDEKKLTTAINSIVDQLHVQAASRDSVTGIVSELKTDYGLNPKIVRRAAKIIFDQNVEEIDQETQAVMDIIDNFNS